MGNLVLVARIVLAAVFLLAGIAKLADLEGSRRAMAGFGLPARLARPVGLLLPLGELVVAVALLPAQSAAWGGLGALLLLLVFIAGIGLNMARGRAPDCHCFGQLHSQPVGPGTLARNVGLAAIALFVALLGWTHPGPGALDWLGELTPGQRLAVVDGALVIGLLAVQSWLVWWLIGMSARLRSVEAALASAGLAPAAAPAGGPSGVGLPMGVAAPPFALPDLTGRTIALNDLLRPGKPLLLLFTDPGCGPCVALKPDIARWQNEHASNVTIAVLSRGTPGDNMAGGGFGAAPVLLQEDEALNDSYRIWGTPGAVVIRPDGTIGSRSAQGGEQIRSLLAESLPNRADRLIPLSETVAHPMSDGNGVSTPVTAKVGDPAPAVTLKDLRGRDVSLSEFRGRDTLLLFWSSSCGFCQQMLPDLQAWEADPPTDAPQLVLAISDPSGANQIVPLRSPALIDVGGATSEVFGANGTPMAVLIDGEGRVASELAVGAEEVLTLAGRKPAPALPGS